jgi:hypothetical protein
MELEDIEDLNMDKYRIINESEESDESDESDESEESEESEESDEDEAVIVKDEKMFSHTKTIGKTIDSKELFLELVELKQHIIMNIYMLDRIKEYIDFETEIKKTNIIPDNTHKLFQHHFKIMLETPDSYVPVYTKEDYDDMLSTINSDRETYRMYRDFIRLNKHSSVI